MSNFVEEVTVSVLPSSLSSAVKSPAGTASSVATVITPALREPLVLKIEVESTAVLNLTSSCTALIALTLLQSDRLLQIQM